MEERTVFEDDIDRLVALDTGQRGIAHLYEAERARAGEPLVLQAARHLAKLTAGDVAVIITGSLTRAWVSPEIGETDGPPGAAALARAIAHGFKAVPLVVVDDGLVRPTARTILGSGLWVGSWDEA